MSRFLVYLARFAMIILGFAVAALAASAFLHLVWFGLFRSGNDELAGLVAGSAWVSIPFVALFAAYFAFLPAMAVLVLAELLGRRDWLFYALGGGATSVPFLVFMLPAVFVSPDGDGLFLAAVIVGSGLVGGIAYWAVAGRGAGAWRDQFA